MGIGYVGGLGFCYVRKHTKMCLASHWPHHCIHHVKHSQKDSTCYSISSPSTCYSISSPDAADDNTESSEVQSIIESTPELDMDLSGYKDAR